MVVMSSNVIQPLLSRMQYPIWEKVLKSSGINEDEIQMIVEKIKLAYISWNKNAFPGAIGNTNLTTNSFVALAIEQCVTR